MAILDDMDAKLDQLVSLMGEEVNVHPDILRPEAVAYMTLPLTWNSAAPFSCEVRVEDREGGRYIRFRFRDPSGYWIMDRAWRAVYRDPVNPGAFVDKPGQNPR